MTSEGLIKNLFNAGAHFAFSKSRRHPSAKPFIFGVKNKVEIFDLEKTAVQLEAAKEFLAKIASEGGQILFVGSKNEAREIVKSGAKEAEMPFVSTRWVGGSLTNFAEIRKRVNRLEDLRSQTEKGELGKYTKKERLLIEREIESLEKSFDGLVLMKRLPAALFIIDSKKEAIAVKEAKVRKIPVVSLSSSDCDLNVINFAIPGNDSSPTSIKFFVNEIVEAIEKGKLTKKETKDNKED